MFPPDTRVLIVDDLQTIRIMLADIFARLGMNKTDQAEDGDKAWTKMINAIDDGRPYGLIVCDWNMPGMNGIELLDKRNKHEYLRNTPFLMVTIESEKENVLTAITKGANDFVVKPFTEEIIRQKLESICQRL